MPSGDLDQQRSPSPLRVTTTTTRTVENGRKQDPSDPGTDLAADSEDPKGNIGIRFLLATKAILSSSLINLLLVCVPVGIAAHLTRMPAWAVFATNAIAIVPLAGLLSHATESLASRVGDSIGALMNVTFGNAVELIIFIIALVKNHIRIVQASLVGSILVNLLLILGMCFLLGGLRFREQIYNSTVTQMSACLLALSVTSLLLPAAFHASFSSEATADDRVLRVSRGTSVIVLVVYFLYLIFQLKSHSYIYASTPRHIVERETLPGPAAQYFNPSSSESSESSPDSDSGRSRETENTAQRFRRMVRRGKMVQRGGTDNHNTNANTETMAATTTSANPASVGSGDGPDVITPENPATKDVSAEPASHPVSGRQGRRQLSQHRSKGNRSSGKTCKAPRLPHEQVANETGRVDFATGPALEAQQEPSRQRPRSSFTLRPLSIFTTRALAPSSVPQALGSPHGGIRRARNEPVPRNEGHRSLDPTMPPIISPSVYNNPQPRCSTPRSPRRPDANSTTQSQQSPQIKHHPASRTTAVLLLLTSTALVAVCAEFMVSSIDKIVSADAGVSEAFIGLILLPLVGNAAEHITAVSVALKNKMDLAIGVAVGSSIQIALFVTPLVVILGWVLGKDMSLFFTLFETVCVFVSAFIVNFLVLDGRSNYLEGALLCAGYIIIAVAAFFYPDAKAANELGGGV